MKGRITLPSSSPPLLIRFRWERRDYIIIDMKGLHPCRLGDVNPFTAMPDAPSLGKRPTKVTNLKSLRICSTLCMSTTHTLEKSSVKMLNTESRSVIRPSKIYCLQACMCTLFSPEILQGCGSGGVNG